MSKKAIAYALITSGFICCYSLVDTYGIQTVDNPLTYISWLFIIKGFLLLAPVVCLHKITWQAIQTEYQLYLSAGILAGIGYAIVIYAFLFAATPSVLALRSTVILVALFLSVRILREHITKTKIVLTCMITGSVFLILLSG